MFTRPGSPCFPTSIVPAFQRWISCDDSSPRLSASLAPRDSSEVPPGGTQWESTGLAFIPFCVSGWWLSLPLWKILVSWDDEIPNMMGKSYNSCSKPPTSLCVSKSWYKLVSLPTSVRKDDPHIGVHIPCTCQWEFQDLKMEVLYYIRAIFCGDIPLHRPQK